VAASLKQQQLVEAEEDVARRLLHARRHTHTHTYA
jgi:hypothetical protein